MDIEDLKCCGNCFYLKTEVSEYSYCIQYHKGVCDPTQYCKDWMYDNKTNLDRRQIIE